MIGIIYFIFALGIIVLVHELGHLIVAKRNGVYCHEFSIGMGPKIKTIKTDADGTVYNIRAIPLGGYVMMAGEESEKQEDMEVPKDQLLNNKTPWQRFKVLIAGSVMNVILTFVLLTLLMFFNGVASNSNEVRLVEKAPAYEAIESTEIRITAINGTEVSSYEQIVSELDAGGQEVQISYIDIENNKETAIVNKDENGKVGIQPTVERFRPIRSIVNGLKKTGALFVSLIIMLKELFSPNYGVQDLSGPIGIYQMSSDVLSVGISAAVVWIAYLSINIGVMNLLPIPALDGGRLVFVIYEMITRKKVNAKIETYLIIGSMLALLGLFVVVSFNDVLRLFS